MENRIATTIQVTGDCNLACTYCYQQHKNHHVIKIEDAKRFIDKLITNDQSFWRGYLDFESKGFVLEFTGGECLMHYKIVIELIDYFKQQCYNLHKPWVYCNSYFNIGTNGTIYNEEIADLIRRHPNKIFMSITVDGCKELHDQCRRFKNSNAPSYDIVVNNLQKYRELVDINNTKITIAPENLPFLSDSIYNLYKILKYTDVHANCVFEDVWSNEDPTILYQQLVKVSDFCIENFEELPPFSFFNEQMFRKEYTFNSAWCGGNGRMVFLQYDGRIYNCMRYGSATVGEEKSLPIGDIEHGITNTDLIQRMKAVTRNSMWDDECKNCSVAKGCADCLAYCYEQNGEWKKIKSICGMHKARSLANVYHWNRYYLQHNLPKVFLMHLSKEEALKIITLEEYKYLWSISNGRYIDNMIQRGETGETIEWICTQEFGNNSL